jgi:hypothetical protein
VEIYDRSALEILCNACITDNIELEIGIYQKDNASWVYVPAGPALDAGREYKAAFRLANIGVEIDFKDCELRIKKTEDTLPLRLYRELGQPPVERVDFKDIPWLRSGEQAPNVYRVVYFAPENSIGADARHRLFRIGVYGTVVPQGHRWHWASQGEFSAPTLHVPDRLDFGDVSFTRTVAKNLELDNVGEGDLTITEVVLEEGSDFSIRDGLSLPYTLPTGQKVPVGIAFSPSGLGDKGGTLTVQSTDLANPTATVVLAGRGVHSFRATPQRINFGEVIVSETRTRRVRLQNDGREDVAVDDIEVSGRYFSCSASTLTVGAGQIVNLDVVFSPTRQGTWTGNLTGFSSYAANPEIDVALTGEALYWLKATPDPVNFGTVTVGHRSSPVELQVMNLHASTCEITDITVSGENFGHLPIFHGVVELDSGDAMTVTSVWAEPTAPGVQEGHLRIVHRLKGEVKTWTLMVRLTVRGR